MEMERGGSAGVFIRKMRRLARVISCMESLFGALAADNIDN